LHRIYGTTERRALPDLLELEFFPQPLKSRLFRERCGPTDLGRRTAEGGCRHMSCGPHTVVRFARKGAAGEDARWTAAGTAALLDWRRNKNAARPTVAQAG